MRPIARTVALRAEASIDPEIVAAIKVEGLQRSQVMDLAWNLTEGVGPRLTGTPQERLEDLGHAAAAKRRQEALTARMVPLPSRMAMWADRASSEDWMNCREACSSLRSL